MVAPTAYDITISINDVDVTAYCPSNTIEHDDHRTSVSEFRCRVENPSGVVPAKNHTVKVVANSLSNTPTIFWGYILELETHKRDNGITVEYDIRAVDIKYRLQKTVLDIAELTGSDTDILSGLLSNAYPDLSSILDFTSGVNGFASDLILPTGNKSILEALNDLSDLTGGADWRFEPFVDDNQLVTFDTGVDDIGVAFGTDTPPAKPYLLCAMTAGSSLTQPAYDASNGNPDDCARWNPSSGSWTPSGGGSNGNPLCFLSYINAGTNVLTDVTFDYFLHSALSDDVQMFILISHTGGTESVTISGLTYGAWASISLAAAGVTFPLTLDSGDSIRLQFEPKAATTIDMSVTTTDVRWDNVQTSFNTPVVGGGEDSNRLKWGVEPDAADFDFDIPTSDEFGFDFDLFEGDYDNYNSITIIGGSEELAIDWTYPNQNSQKHVNLETHITSLAVFTNSGSEGSPSWTALDVGQVGEDELGVAGIDVLYDPVTHWLEFNSAPPNFYDAVRVTGNILRPIRVRVENIAAGDPTYATTYEDDSITSTDQALAIGTTKLDQRNTAKRLTFTTHNPGLKVGQAVTVTDSNRGLSESLVIQRIHTRLMNALAIFEVECGDTEVDSVDTKIANNETQSQTNLQAGISTLSFGALVDANNILVEDAYGRYIYGIAA